MTWKDERIDYQDKILCCKQCTRPVDVITLCNWWCHICNKRIFQKDGVWRLKEIVVREVETANMLEQLYKSPSAVRPAPNR